MSDEIRINPFTNKPLTASEIKKLDTNNDGIVSKNELYSNNEFLSLYQGQDEDGEIAFNESKNENVAKNIFSGSLTLAKAPAEPVIGAGKGVLNFLGGVGGFLGSFGTGLMKGTYNGLYKGLFNSMKNISLGFYNGFKGLFTGVWGGIKNIFTGNIFKGLGSIAKGVFGLGWNVISGLGKGIAAMGKGLGKFVGSIGSGIYKGAKKVVKGIGKAAKSIGNGIAKGVKAVGKGIKKIFKGW